MLKTLLRLPLLVRLIASIDFRCDSTSRPTLGSDFATYRSLIAIEPRPRHSGDTARKAADTGMLLSAIDKLTLFN